MFNYTNYTKLVKDSKIIVDSIKMLENQGLQKNKDKIALLNMTLFLMIKEMQKEMKF